MQTRERDRISNLAKSDPSAALHAARLLSDPFTKCQTLAWVARYTKTAADVVKVAGEAERALQATADPWEASAGAAWIVRALLERAQVREADVVFKRATTAARRLADTGRRVDALFLLIQAGWASAGPSWRAAVKDAIDAATATSRDKPLGVVRDLVLMLAGDGRDYSAALAALPEGKAKRQAERRLQDRAFTSPRPFFW